MVSEQEVEQIISAWAFAHNIDGAARNDLFARLRAANPIMGATTNPAPCAAPPMGLSPGYREVTIDRNTRAIKDTTSGGE